MLVTQGSTGDSLRRGIGDSKACEPETGLSYTEWLPLGIVAELRLLRSHHLKGFFLLPMGSRSQAAGKATRMLLTFIIIDWPLSWWYRVVLAGRAKRSLCPIH